MSEKEERIAVAKMLVNTDDEGSAKLDHFKIYSRQEAIERMAKAFWPWNYTPSEIQSGKSWETMTEWERGGWLGLAKAALNALLGE